MAELVDGRVALLEYKGAHLQNDPYEIEKSQVGALWAQTSGGRAVFGWLTKQQGGKTWRSNWTRCWHDAAPSALPSAAGPRPIDIACSSACSSWRPAACCTSWRPGRWRRMCWATLVLQFSTIIGTYLFAMGGGRGCRATLSGSCLRTFAHRAAGGADRWRATAHAVLANAYVPGRSGSAVRHGADGGHAGGAGDSAGHAHPEAQHRAQDLVSQVLTFDYLGALAVSLAFPLLLVPHLGLIRTGLLFG